MADNLSELPEALQFLRPYMVKGPKYRTAHWLRSSFDDAVWILRTTCKGTINWQVPVGKGRILLTDPIYTGVLEVFRTWIIFSTHVDGTGGKVLGPHTEHQRIHRVLDCIDYILLNADRLQLRQYGLRSLTRDDYCAMYAKICSHRMTSTAIYDWPNRAAAYLRAGISTLDDVDVSNLIQVHPFLAKEIPDPIDRLTDLSDAEVVRARVWMWTQCRYRDDRKNRSGFRYSPDSTHLTRQIYGCIVGRIVGFPTIRELGLVPGYHVEFEYPKAPVVSSNDTRTGRKNLVAYLRTILLLNALQEMGLEVATVPREGLESIRGSIVAKRAGRFSTLPSEAVFFALRKSIDFAMDHGTHLVQSFVALAAAAKQAGRTTYKQAEFAGIRTYLTSETAELGVKSWTVESCAAGSGVISAPPVVLSGPEYFKRFRANHGLFELLLVLYGSIQVSLGILSARRQGELQDLVCGEVLDVSRTRLVFQNRKSGAMGCREAATRPIPPVAVELVGILEKLHNALVEAGVETIVGRLFVQPQQRGERTLGKIDSSRYNAAIDYFCDYIEMPLNRIGQRYYLRQHQLRRFFAMLFFWAGGFGGIDTLRYFLAHTNAEHVWNYITESIPGKVLRGAQATFALESVCKESPAAEALADVLEVHFKTRNFNLVDTDTLSSHIEDLIAEGIVTVEPQFLDHGRTYRVAILINGAQS